MRVPDFRVSFGLLFVLFAIVLPISALGEDATKAHVAVVRFSNKTNSVSYDAACKAATDTLYLTLSQLGRYRVQADDAMGSGEDALRVMAEGERLDFIMYGQMSKAAAGGIVCSLSVYDRAKGKTTLSQSRKAAGVLDIFEAVDELVVSVLESMTGAHIGFGSLTLTNTGEQGSYTVLVDGTAAGSSLVSLDRVLNGRRTVTIVQKRMLGDREIARSIVAVKEGETTELKFAVPFLMADEKAKVEGLEAAIEAGLSDPSVVGDVDAKIAQFSMLFGDVSYSPKLSTYKDEATEMIGEWALRKSRIAIENSAWDPEIELLDSTGPVYMGATSYPDPGKIRKTFEENAQLLETLFELEAGNALSGGDLGKALNSFGKALMVSTRYLDGKRMTDYAYAMTLVQNFQETGSTNTEADNRNMKTVFGDTMLAGQRFYGLKDQVASGKTSALVASDFSKALSVAGGGYADAPLAVQMPEAHALSVQPKGDATAVTVTDGFRSKLLFVEDGYAPFGKVGLNSAPGTIEASATIDRSVVDTSSQATIKVSLDGGVDVEIPHVFENVPAGSHVMRIPEVRIGSKLYAGLEENVTVEPGKRLIFNPILSRGSAKIHIDDIPEGSKFLIDGDEQVLTGNSSGDLVFDGTIDAGTPRLDVIDGNKDWYSIPYLPIDTASIRIYSVKHMALQATLQRKSIKIKKETEDWAGVEPIFSSAETVPSIPGTIISGGSVCRDDKNLYVKIDFSNGKPEFLLSDRSLDRMLQLYENKPPYNIVNLQLSGGKDGVGSSSMWLQSSNSKTIAGSYSIGPSFIELGFPLSLFSKYFDFAKPIRARFQTQLNDPFFLLSDSPDINIVVGDNQQSKSASTKSRRNMAEQIILQRKSILLQGKEEDWAGVEPAVRGVETIPPNMPGTIISGGSVCRDDKNLYVKIDFSNGKPDFLLSDRSSDRMLQLTGNKPPYDTVNLQLSGGKDGVGRSSMWVSSTTTRSEAGSYSIGPSFIELSFPLYLFSRYFDFSKPIRARLQTQLNDPYFLLSTSPSISIIVGNDN